MSQTKVSHEVQNVLDRVIINGGVLNNVNKMDLPNTKKMFGMVGYDITVVKNTGYLIGKNKNTKCVINSIRKKQLTETFKNSGYDVPEEHIYTLLHNTHPSVIKDLFHPLGIILSDKSKYPLEWYFKHYIPTGESFYKWYMHLTLHDVWFEIGAILSKTEARTLLEILIHIYGVLHDDKPRNYTSVLYEPRSFSNLMINELLNKESSKKEWMLKEYLANLCIGQSKGDKDTYNATVLAGKYSITSYSKKTNLSLNGSRKPYSICVQNKNGSYRMIFTYSTFLEAVTELKKHPDRYHLIISEKDEYTKGLKYVPTLRDFIYNHIN